MTNQSIEGNLKYTRTYPEIKQGDKVIFSPARNTKRKDTYPIYSEKYVAVLDTTTEYSGNKQPLYSWSSVGKILYQGHDELFNV